MKPGSRIFHDQSESNRLLQPFYVSTLFLVLLENDTHNKF